MLTTVLLRYLTILSVILTGVTTAHARPFVVSIYTPEEERFELAYDELEINWTAAPNARETNYGAGVRVVPGTTVMKSAALRVIISVSAVSDARRLSEVASVLERANPGAEVHLVLYEPGRVRDPGTRRLLTREVGLMGSDLDPFSALAGLPYTDVQAGPVIGSWIVRAKDQLGALTLASALRRRAGVHHAYPLLQQEPAPRR